MNEFRGEVIGSERDAGRGAWRWLRWPGHEGCRAEAQHAEGGGPFRTGYGSAGDVRPAAKGGRRRLPRRSSAWGQRRNIGICTMAGCGEDAPKRRGIAPVPVRPPACYRILDFPGGLPAGWGSNTAGQQRFQGDGQGSATILSLLHRGGGLHQFHKAAGLETRTANQAAVDVLLRQQFRRVGRLHRSTV
jgi:hypothetical protein